MTSQTHIDSGMSDDGITYLIKMENPRYTFHPSVKSALSGYLAKKQTKKQNGNRKAKQLLC